MILSDKKILIMGIRNKWSIAWGAAQSAYEQGAEVIFTCGSMEKIEKIKELTDEIPNSKVYACDASSDESIRNCMEQIKANHGKVDGISGMVDINILYFTILYLILFPGLLFDH